MIPQLLNWLVNSTPVLSTVNSIVSSSGRLFHYIGDPDSKASGGVTTEASAPQSDQSPVSSLTR